MCLHSVTRKAKLCETLAKFKVSGPRDLDFDFQNFLQETLSGILVVIRYVLIRSYGNHGHDSSVIQKKRIFRTQGVRYSTFSVLAGTQPACFRGYV